MQEYGRRPMNQYGYRSTGTVKHTHVKPKTRVKVVLHDGTTFIDVFLRQEGKVHYFKDRGKLKSNQVLQLQVFSKSREIQKQIEAYNHRKNIGLDKR